MCVLICCLEIPIRTFLTGSLQAKVKIVNNLIQNDEYESYILRNLELLLWE